MTARPPSGAAAAADDARPQPTWLHRTVTAAFYLVAVGFSAVLLNYYATGAGGPTLLAVSMVPVAYILLTLHDLRQGTLYPRLPPTGSALVGLVQIALAAFAALHLYTEFDSIRTVRVGRWSELDLAAGAVLILLLLEYSRRKYLPLFFLNIALALYVVYGGAIPGIFGHAGMSWRRVVTSMSLETSTGIFERLPQLALTLIGSFILVLAVLRGFGAVDSMLKGAQRLAARSPYLLPQAAVLGSFGVAMVSGSGAANAATTGSVTIPALIKAGLSRVRAAAIESATSLGGQLMPPLMGIAAFLMADFMGVSYFEVVARGFAPAIIYFVGVSVAVYILSARSHVGGEVPEVEPVGFVDKVNLLAYAAAIGGLIYLMGALRTPPMLSARYVFVGLVVALSLVFLARSVRTPEGRRPGQLLRPYRRTVETFARMTAELTVLLAILGLVTASFTITGVPTSVGMLMIDVASVSVVLVILVAFLFGTVVGMGLAPAPTYIVVAVVIAPFMVAVGFDVWTVHFYAFLIAVFGELTPPTSVTAAVTSRIADAPFVQTMFRAVELCLPLFALMVAVFTWPELVAVPGAAQLLPFAFVLVGTLGVIASLHSEFSDRPPVQQLARLALLALGTGILLRPALPVAVLLAVVVVLLAGYGILRTRARARTREDAQRRPSPLASQP